MCYHWRKLHPSEIIADDHFAKRGTLQPMRHAALADPVDGLVSGFPVAFSDGPLPEMAGAPTLGMHNREIYEGILGMTPVYRTGLG